LFLREYGAELDRQWNGDDERLTSGTAIRAAQDNMTSVKAFILAILPLMPVTPGATAKHWGNASCSGHRYIRVAGKTDANEHGTKHCDFLIGDPHNIPALKWKSIPDGERLLVLGRSDALEGYSHGDSWYQVKTRDGRTGYVDYSGVKCDGAPDSCKGNVVE
jgi:hypothetical protein